MLSLGTNSPKQHAALVCTAETGNAPPPATDHPESPDSKLPLATRVIGVACATPIKIGSVTMAAASTRFVIDRNPREVFRKTHANNDTRNFEVFDDAGRRCACAGRLLFWQRRSAPTRRPTGVVQNCEVVDGEHASLAPTLKSMNGTRPAWYWNGLGRGRGRLIRTPSDDFWPRSETLGVLRRPETRGRERPRRRG